MAYNEIPSCHTMRGEGTDIRTDEFLSLRDGPVMGLPKPSKYVYKYIDLPTTLENRNTERGHSTPRSRRRKGLRQINFP